MSEDYQKIEEYFLKTFGLTLRSVYWGEFHAHTCYSIDAKGMGARCPEAAFKFARKPEREGGPQLDFLALNDHAEMPSRPQPTSETDQDEHLRWVYETYEDAPDPLWQSTLGISRAHNKEDVPREAERFIVFPGWEYTNVKDMRIAGSHVGYGHKTVIFQNLNPTGDDAPLPDVRYAAGTPLEPGDRSKNAPTPAALWRRLEEHRPSRTERIGSALTIIHTPAKGGVKINDHSSDVDIVDVDFVRNIEIYSQHGNSEGPPPGHNKNLNPKDRFNEISTNDPSKTVRALIHDKWCENGDARYRFSFIACTDNHMGLPGYMGKQETMGEGEEASPVDAISDHVMAYHGGKTGIPAKRKVRDALWKNLWRRHTIASSGYKIPVLFAGEIKTTEHQVKPLLMGDCYEGEGVSAVHLRAIAPSHVVHYKNEYESCDSIQKIAVGIRRIDLMIDGELVDSFPGNILDKVIDDLDPGKRHFIYIRVVTDDENRVWTSPIYIGKPERSIR
ncbi:MAG: DUF3604 domain-containing protein [Myxococcota bacterium]|nr:DUF3604 domain-containing protein [Myxococcota bacterium]